MHWPQMYKNVFKSLDIYWHSYGGRKDLISSPYLHISVGFSFIATFIHFFSPTWLWFDLARDILPSLLGFSLGGYAVFLAFGNEKFIKAIKGPDEDGSPSPFMLVNGAFVHFILLQAVTLLYGIFFKVLDINWLLVACFGYLLLTYSILSLVAATLVILNFASWFDKSDI